MKHLLSLTIACLVLIGCSRLGSSRYSTQHNPDGETMTAIITQRDRAEQPLFAIAWIHPKAEDHAAMHGGELHRRVLDGEDGLSPTERAIYALQPDGRLKALALDEQDLRALLEEFGNEDFFADSSELWQQKVAPRLHQVEARN